MNDMILCRFREEKKERKEALLAQEKLKAKVYLVPLFTCIDILYSP